MSESYPRRDQARGIWKINDITKNIKDDGTYPQEAGGTRALFMGGYTAPSHKATIELITVETTGNATDFGDLTQARGGSSTNSNFIRGVCISGRTPSVQNTMDYVTISTTGNAADFGDLNYSAIVASGHANTTIGLTGGGETPSRVNNISKINLASLGNAVDYGDLTQARGRLACFGTSIRAFWAGGDSPSARTNTIDQKDISSDGNAIDFGDLNTATNEVQGTSNFTLGFIAGGAVDSPGITNVIDSLVMGSKGNAVDWGDLTVARGGLGGVTGSLVRGVCGGGEDPSRINTIDYWSLVTRGNAVDFGDLLGAQNDTPALSNNHGGLDAESQRAPELYSPTGKIVPNGLGQGDIGVYNGGESPGPTALIEFIQISNIGNAADFGDLTAANAIGGAVSSATRYVTIGDNDSNLDTHYLEFRSKGNTAFFGDLTVRGYAGAGGSNSTRGINYGRANPATSGTANETIDYITTATIGNWTDFGNCNVASYFNGGTNSSTRMVKCGGITEGPNTITDSMEYVTMASTGNGTDFGDLVASNGGFSCGNVSNGTRGIFGGGSVNPANNTNTNVIQYITIASTGNTTDFGDLTVARRYSGSSCNSTRGVWAGGENPSNSNTMDYVTIASTGNAIDYGDLSITVSRHGGASNGHGGLS